MDQINFFEIIFLVHNKRISCNIFSYGLNKFIGKEKFDSKETKQKRIADLRTVLPDQHQSLQTVYCSPHYVNNDRGGNIRNHRSSSHRLDGSGSWFLQSIRIKIKLINNRFCRISNLSE